MRKLRAWLVVGFTDPIVDIFDPINDVDCECIIQLLDVGNR